MYHHHVWSSWPLQTSAHENTAIDNNMLVAAPDKEVDEKCITSYGIVAFSPNMMGEKICVDRNNHGHTRLKCKVCASQTNKFSKTTETVSPMHLNVLLIERKITNALHDILCGRYSIENEPSCRKQLITLLSELTCEERWHLLRSNTYNEVCEEINYYPRIAGAYKQKLSNCFAQNREKLCSILASLFPYFTHYPSREFGFPKGRRHKQESKVLCALREFCEETGYGPEDVRLLNTRHTLKEDFIGSDGKRYQHIYYIAIITTPLKDITTDQAFEVRRVGWYSIDDAYALLQARHYDKTKLAVLRDAVTRLKHIYCHS